MRIKTIYSKSALKALEKLDQQISQKIFKKIKSYVQSNNPLKYAKKLNPPFNDLYRFKIGEYRAIFEKDTKDTILFLIILKVGHRKDMYE